MRCKLRCNQPRRARKRITQVSIGRVEGRIGNGGERKKVTSVVFQTLKLSVSPFTFGNEFRRWPLPESPKPYLPPPKETKSLFPESEELPLSSEGLPEYIRNFNRSHTSKIHIWARTRSSPESKPVIVQLSVPDVLVVFLTVGHDSTSNVLIIETVTAFGPREKVSPEFLFCERHPHCDTHVRVQKAPHAYSDYTAFQDLSQQLAHMVRSDPHVSFQSFMVSPSRFRSTISRICISGPAMFL
jgi:hypothetical protein